MNLKRSTQQGFTLLEVLIALVILAVALAAATRASQLATDSTLTVKQRLIGNWIAENRLVAVRTSSNPWPDTGTQTGEETQAGSTFTWQQTVSDTPNPIFRRVEIKVFAGSRTDYAIATLVGYLSKINS